MANCQASNYKKNEVQKCLTAFGAVHSNHVQNWDWDQIPSKQTRCYVLFHFMTALSLEIWLLTKPQLQKPAVTPSIMNCAYGGSPSNWGFLEGLLCHLEVNQCHLCSANHNCSERTWPRDRAGSCRSLIILKKQFLPSNQPEGFTWWSCPIKPHQMLGVLQRNTWGDSSSHSDSCD